MDDFEVAEGSGDEGTTDAGGESGQVDGRGRRRGGVAEVDVLVGEVEVEEGHFGDCDRTPMGKRKVGDGYCIRSRTKFLILNWVAFWSIGNDQGKTSRTRDVVRNKLQDSVIRLRVWRWYICLEIKTPQCG